MQPISDDMLTKSKICVVVAKRERAPHVIFTLHDNGTGTAILIACRNVHTKYLLVQLGA